MASIIKRGRNAWQGWYLRCDLCAQTILLDDKDPEPDRVGSYTNVFLFWCECCHKEQRHTKLTTSDALKI